jgi:uncharacterized protein (DUF1697 family)
VNGGPAKPPGLAGIGHKYVAFLRGVTPQNASMADIKRCFESAGFGEVRTVLASGNVVFSSRLTSLAEIQDLAEQAMAIGMGRTFGTVVRSAQSVRALLSADPFAEFSVPQEAKRVVTFLRDAKRAGPELPIERDGVQILKRLGNDVLTAYVPHPKGPVFMVMLEKAFGKDITTRTLDTVRKCLAAA